MLTGKARKDFIEYHYNQVDFTKESHEENYELFLANTEDIHQLASVVDWLDSIGIYVYVEPSIPIGWENPDCFIFRVGTETNRSKYKDRQQATEKAIERANEIYNSK